MIRHIMVSLRVAYLLMARNQRSEMMKRMGQGQDMVPKDSAQECTLFKLPTSPKCPSKCKSSMDQSSGGDRTLVISHFPKVQPLNIVILGTFIT